MKQQYPAIVDANRARVAEGLRVIEEYVRFLTPEAAIVHRLAALRKAVRMLDADSAVAQLQARDTKKDLRAQELPPVRATTRDLLLANFKRAQEGLRVLEEYTGNARYNRLRYDLYALEKDVVLRVLQKRIRRGVYLISDRVDVLEQGLRWGVAMIQLRDKTSSKTVIMKKAQRLQRAARKADVPLIINDHFDIAMAVDADGFHSGQDDLPVDRLRAMLGSHKILGRTAHTLAQGKAAERAGADYVSVGPIWATPSKPERPAIGFSYLQKARTALTIPYVAIGGVTLERMPQIMHYRPPMVALIRDYKNIPTIRRFFR